MRVLMISTDRGMFGNGPGDAVTRHKAYADAVGHLDVIVFASKHYQPVVHAQNFRVLPTRSYKWSHWRAAATIVLQCASEAPYDLLVTQDLTAPAGISIKKKIGLPWIISVHGMFFSKEWLRQSPVNWYVLWRIKGALPHADGFRVNNLAIEKRLRAWDLTQPVLVQPTPISLNKFFVKSKPYNQVPHVLYVGRLSSEKNIAMLIKAIRSIQEAFQLTIIGDGREKRTLESLAAGDDRIIFLGMRPYEELSKYYRDADIFVLPSNTESFGKVLLEAGAARCAILATRTTGALSILNDQTDALLVDIGNVESLRGGIERLIKDTALRNKLGQAAQETARMHNAEEGIKKTVAFWRRIAGKA